MSFLWEKSGIWQWVVVNGKHSKSFFMAFTSLCLVSSWALSEAVMRTTNLSQTQLDAELRKRGRSDPMLMGRVNKERLGQLLEEIQRKENTEDRYSGSTAWGNSYWYTRCSRERRCRCRHACNNCCCCHFSFSFFFFVFSTARNHCCSFANWSRCQ